MTDYTELKPLLDACRAENVDDPREFRKAVEALFDVCTVETISALITENERLKTLRSTTERDLAQELEVWRHGPSCWNCGDTGDVHDMVGEWRGQCDCNAAKLIDVSSERDQLKAENEALVSAMNEILRVTPMGVEAFGIAALVLGELSSAARGQGEQS